MTCELFGFLHNGSNVTSSMRRAQYQYERLTTLAVAEKYAFHANGVSFTTQEERVLFRPECINRIKARGVPGGIKTKEQANANRYRNGQDNNISSNYS